MTINIEFHSLLIKGFVNFVIPYPKVNQKPRGAFQHYRSGSENKFNDNKEILITLIVLILTGDAI